MSAEARVEVTVRPARDAAEVEAAQRLRVEVFCGEQGVSESEELDGLDDQALHLIALEDDEVIATCRLRFDGTDCRLERMAVAAGRRGIGLGLSLVGAAEGEARRAGATTMLLHGQLQARGFYERAGYGALSEEILVDAGIEHVRMSKAL